MRLIKNAIDRDGMGAITLFPEEPEDMWHAYNLIHPQDLLHAAAVRKVVTESATGSTSTSRVHTFLTISVEKIDFDPPSSTLHINGRVAAENKHVKIGSYHTLDLELNRNFSITKAHGWDSVSLQVVADACNTASKAEIGAVVMHEGLANVCLVTEYMTVLRQRIEVPIPRKRRGNTAAFDKGMEKFFDTVYQSILRHFPIESLKVILLASPGFLAEGLLDYIMENATKAENKAVITARRKFITEHCSTGHVHALNELLKSPSLQAKLANTRFIKESKAIDRFFEMMTADENRAWYGPKEVARAVDKGAVSTLLLSNTLLRSDSVAERRKYVRMVEEVGHSGGESLVLSSIHESGRRLDGLGGVAAILSYPVMDLDESEPEEEENGEAEGGGEGERNKETGSS
ncbi:hypothetical protein BDZ91DRAFT_698906 [Kalaharituber pfeilii]|nr:hypothetical protein BDZ91DRAFT_698906 [Kalaharituber pfeilii]